jgi:hypothetical protein
MLKQEDLAFLKAISAARQSPALLRELRKALAASKEKRAVALRKAGSAARDPTRRQQDSKRKASHLDSDSSGEPATRRPAQEQIVSSLLQRDRLPRAARSQTDQHKPRWRTGELLCCKVGPLSPQPWSRTHPTPLPLLRQHTGACRNTCPGL